MSQPPHRFAIYYTPPAGSALECTAAAWLGRSAWAGESVAGGRGPDALVSAPRRYGFHATMKAPFRLAEGRTEPALREALETFCAEQAPVLVPRLTLTRLGAFFALTEEAPGAAMTDLAAAAVERFEPFRAPLSPDERARRLRTPLPQRETNYLDRYGYPYVMDAFRFHMTLTGPVPEAGRDAVEAELAERFADAIGRPLRLDALTLFAEPEPASPFRALASVPLTG